MYCNHCGNKVSEEAIVCPSCGCNPRKKNKAKATDAKSTGFFVLGFFLPVIGLILYVVWKNKYPLRAESIGKGTKTGLTVFLTLYLISMIFKFFI